MNFCNGPFSHTGFKCLKIAVKSLHYFFFCSSCKKGEIQKPDPFTRNVSLDSSTGRNKTTAREWLSACARLSSVRVLGDGRGRMENISLPIKMIFFFMHVFVFRVLKDQWIRAKYERREFTGESSHQPVYCSGHYLLL